MKISNHKAKILVIDDDPDFRKIVSLMLKPESYDVITAKNPRKVKRSSVRKNQT